MSVKLYPVDDLQFLLHDGPDYISQQLRQGQSWEPLLLSIIDLLLKGMKEPVFVDVGANLGAVSVPVGKLIQQRHRLGGGLGQVHSIEAQRNVFYQLCGNFFANDLGRYCFAYHTAIGDVVGGIEIPFLSLRSEQNVGALSLDKTIRQEQGWKSEFEHYETVPMTTLDELGLPPASLIKIDVEGMELEVVRGGLLWLKESCFPPILFEVWGDDMEKQIAKREALLNLLHAQGYECLVHGELGIAQHHNNRYLDFIYDKDNKLSQISLIKK